MRTDLRRHKIAALLGAVVLSLGTGIGCSVDEPNVPMTGPSEFALSVAMTASPNELPRDGASQSIVTISVRDAQGRAVQGQSLSLSLPVNVPSGTILSSSSVMTDGGGTATLAVVAPTPNSTGNQIIVTARTGGAVETAMSRTVTISVTPPNASLPVPAFTVNPTAPEIGQAVTFNASGTTDEGVSCLDTCTYAWDFGGEATATGRIVSYTFRAAGTYVVALTVTDAAGARETTRQTVTVGALNPPTVTFTPTTAAAGRQATFTATATAATNHRITSYTWVWGDGTESTTATSPATQHTFATAGSYLVTVTVRDDLGQTASSSQVVTVSSGLTADFSNTAAIVNQDVTFDASRSFAEGGATIQLYSWSWGDGTGDTSTTSATRTHRFSTAGTFTVTLTVADSQGRTATQSRTITVAPAP